MKKALILLSLFFVSCNTPSNGRTFDSATIEVSPESISATALSDTYTVNVKSSDEWTAFSNEEWIKLDIKGSLQKEGSISVKVETNDTNASRNASIIVKSGQLRKSISLTQEAPLQVSNKDIFSSSKGETVSINVLCGGKWEASSQESWIKLEIKDKVLDITIEPNESLSKRDGQITVSFGKESLVIKVHQASAEDRNIVVPEGYHLVWHDEFSEGTELSSDWTYERQGPGWVNNELQTYTKGNGVTELKDGFLNINCFKEDDKIYSARVYAKENTGWLYGYFEARIQLPGGKGTWPAFWMMPVANNFSTNPWPACGEIDIMEEVGCVPNEVSSSIHTKAYNHTINTQKTAKRTLPTAESDFHIYACEWTEDYLRFFVDNKELMTFYNDGKGDRNTWPFTYAFYPILNLAWGGNWGGMYGVDEKCLPATMIIDYVRVFQKQ